MGGGRVLRLRRRRMAEAAVTAKGRRSILTLENGGLQEERYLDLSLCLFLTAHFSPRPAALQPPPRPACSINNANPTLILTSNRHEVFCLQRSSLI